MELLRNSPYRNGDVQLRGPDVSSFVRFIGQLQSGELTGSTFMPWQVELILDLDECSLAARRRRTLLEQYRKHGVTRIARGERPVRFSEFVERRATRRRGSVSVEPEPVVAELLL